MAPRGLRNNNPGNIEYGDFARSHGATGTDGRFAKFATPEAGIKALSDLLDTYAARGLNTPASIIGRYAPPSENQTQAYASSLARSLGISPNTILDLSDPTVKATVIGSIVQVENGQNPWTTGNIQEIIGSTGGALAQSPEARPSLRQNLTQLADVPIPTLRPDMQMAGIGIPTPTLRPDMPQGQTMLAGMSPPAAPVSRAAMGAPLDIGQSKPGGLLSGFFAGPLNRNPELPSMRVGAGNFAFGTELVPAPSMVAASNLDYATAARGASGLQGYEAPPPQNLQDFAAPMNVLSRFDEAGRWMRAAPPGLDYASAARAASGLQGYTAPPSLGRDTGGIPTVGGRNYSSIGSPAEAARGASELQGYSALAKAAPSLPTVGQTFSSMPGPAPTGTGMLTPGQMSLVAGLGNVPGPEIWGTQPITRAPPLSILPTRSATAGAASADRGTAASAPSRASGGFSVDAPGYDPRQGDPSAREVSGEASTVLCTYFMKKGWLPKRIWLADCKFSATLPAHVIKGYHWWAIPAVRRLKRGGASGWVLERLLWPVVAAWARYAAYRLGMVERQPIAGRVIHETLGAFSALAGRIWT